MSELLIRVMDFIALGVGIAGALIVIWGVIMAVVELMRLEFMRAKGRFVCKKREYVRHHLGQYLLLGLEFLIAADIIHTVFKPNIQSLIILGAIVVIRTLISYFLNKELQGGHNCMEDEKP
jgi:uncharacterized membrane protein